MEFLYLCEMTDTKQLEASLEFDKIRTLLEANIRGCLGREHIAQISFSDNYADLSYELALVEECRILLEEGYPTPIAAYDDIRPSLKLLGIQDVVLPLEELISVIRVLEIFQEIEKLQAVVHPQPNGLYGLLEDFNPCSELLAEIGNYFNSDFSIRLDSHPILARIQRDIEAKRQQIDREFSAIVSKYKRLAYLSETAYTVYSGRSVLSVLSEHKRKIRGITHGLSDTAKTCYIEPEELVHAQNELRELHFAYQLELRKLLQIICRKFDKYLWAIKRGFDVLGQLDFLYAKAKLAVHLHACLPRLKEGPFWDWKNAVHPLLWLKNENEAKDTVRFDLELKGNNRIILLSGPNAGGKSVCMKAVGLLQYMLQCGLLVPMEARSEAGLFSKIYIDLGDAQSIRDDLSTYSSKLKVMKYMLDNVDSRSLVLLDEFGSGTDPLFGGAIAEAWLDRILAKRSWGLLTTHYSNLKLFAFKRKGIVNASMLFDQKTLSPKYVLKIGKPGSSFAMEIARKTGFDSAFLSYSKRRIGKKNSNVDQMISALEREQLQTKKMAQQLEMQKKQLDQLVKQYQQLAMALDVQKKKLKIEKKQFDIEKSFLLQSELKKQLKKLKKKEKIEIERELKELKLKTDEDLKLLKVRKLDLVQEELGKPFVFKKGDTVRIDQANASGQIVSIGKQNATVAVGNLKVTVDLADLRPANVPVKRSKKSVYWDSTRARRNFEPKLDIRGYTKKEASDVLYKYLDDAILSSASQVEILHGKGTGVLKELVRDIAGNFEQIKSIKHPEPESGGEGISVLSFG